MSHFIGGPYYLSTLPITSTDDMHICQTHFRDLSMGNSSCRYQFYHWCSGAWAISKVICDNSPVASFPLAYDISETLRCRLCQQCKAIRSGGSDRKIRPNEYKI